MEDTLANREDRNSFMDGSSSSFLVSFFPPFLLVSAFLASGVASGLSILSKLAFNSNNWATCGANSSLLIPPAFKSRISLPLLAMDCSSASRSADVVLNSAIRLRDGVRVRESGVVGVRKADVRMEERRRVERKDVMMTRLEMVDETI